MNYGCFVLACGLTFVLAATGSSQSLISKIPEDGVWAEYAFVGKTRSFPDGAPLEIHAVMTLRSVGAETIERENLRWIEIESNGEFKGEQVKAVEKLLVAEDDVNAGKTLSECLRKRWIYHSQGDPHPRQVDLSTAEGQKLGHFFPNATDEQRSLEGKEIKTPAGEWTCTGVMSELRGNDPIVGDEHVKTLTVYSSPESPFGSVTVSLSQGGFESTNTIGTLTLVRTGTNAKSSLPDVK